MRAVSLAVLLGAAASASAALVPRLGESASFYLVVPPLFLCVLFAWFVTFENDAMRRPRALWEFFVFGLLVPVFSSWAKPIELSFNAILCLVSAAVMLGAIIRMLALAYA
jgi:hypothetical protein